MNVEIAQRLAARRKQAGLSQEALAEKLGVSRQAVSKWERSESSPDTDNLVALAQLYGVSLDELLNVDEDFKDDVAFEAADRAAARIGAEASADGDWFVANSDGFAARDDEGNEVHVTGEGVIINGEHFASWREARKRYGHDHLNDSSKDEPCGYTVFGERFDTMTAVRAKYGSEAGHSIPVRNHRSRGFDRAWSHFLYPLFIVVAYVLLGVFCDAWVEGLFLAFTIPLYYMIGHAIAHRYVAPLLAGAYPLCSVAWFFWMAFVANQPHPAWVVFLTIPLVEWVIWAVARKWHAWRRSKAAAQNAPIEVDASASAK